MFSAFLIFIFLYKYYALSGYFWRVLLYFVFTRFDFKWFCYGGWICSKFYICYANLNFKTYPYFILESITINLEKTLFLVSWRKIWVLKFWIIITKLSYLILINEALRSMIQSMVTKFWKYITKLKLMIVRFWIFIEWWS